MRKIVLATRNKDKIKEIRHIFKMLDVKSVEFLSLTSFANVPEVEEDGKTLKENAIKKAKVVGNYTGLPSLSEDTGLFVEYLNGAPGIYSARYADKDKKVHTATYEDNYKKVLEEMKNVPWEKRKAEFVCVAALYLPQQNKIFTRKGVVKGYITISPCGNNGFGYDPIFYLPEKEKTFAELSLEEKNILSHRFLAMKQIAKVIKSL
ncbi:MAG: RdgB/HAM1 family non-canonical purine NTP pyrophosphatase [Endomicrobiia bacterium]